MEAQDYSKLVKALRCCAEEADCINCPRKGGDCVYGPDGLLTDAAAAIEDLQAEVERLKDCNEELRERQTYIDRYGTEWLTSAKDVPTSAYKHGYADGWDEARAKMEVQNG